MVFYPPKWAGVLPRVPVDISISEFMLSERYGRAPLKKSRDPFTCGITGKSYSAEQVAERVDLLARALAEELNWGANEGANWDKTLGVYSVNTVCFFSFIFSLPLPEPVLSTHHPTDRYLTTCLGHASTWRYRHSCKRSILSQGTGIPIDRRKGKGSLHLRASPENSARGCRQGRHTEGACILA